ncbi:MazG family protein [Aestuariimicrobium sp. Y1814]|uniref:MazG family protein n=1 Tax=Aestuariimicrobium sp. Y1814 TaxID=3418742 RepID=UPI003DA6FA07
MSAAGGELLRLQQVMHRLRRECPWDAKQTHRSLVTYLVEETGEVVDAIETGDDADLREELGDLLLQVYFHAEIADQEGRFTLDDVAAGIADKLVARHPYVFGADEVPEDPTRTWEARKRLEKGRTSALDGIADSLSVLARATKVASRTRNHHVPIDLPDDPVTAEEVGEGILELVLRAHAQGIDADQAGREALRALEARVRAAEASSEESSAESSE